MARIERESYGKGEGGSSGWSTNSAVYIAITFVSQFTYELESCDIRASRPVGVDPGTVTLGLYAVDGSHEPTGAALSEATVVGTTLPETDSPNDAPTTTFTFGSPFSIEIGVEYALQLVAASAASNVLLWVTDTFTGYTNGHTWRWIGSWQDVDSSPTVYINYGDFNASPVTPSDLSHTKRLVAASNNQVWYESSPGTMEELVAARGDIDCGELLNMFEAYGKVFIVNGTNLKVADFQSVKITTADIGANPPDPGTVLTGAGGAEMVVDYITSLTGASVIYGQSITTVAFGAETVTGVDNDLNAISFTGTAEVEGPFWYDWTVFGNDVSYGAIPAKATLGCNYRGRAVISGNSQLPHQWYMSRQAKPHDFLYGVNDAQSAVAGNNADAGEIGDIVTALIPYKDDVLIFGCASTCWYLTGDPVNGGSLDELDLTTGIFGAQSWCWGKDGELFFWGANGIYKVTLPGGTPTCVSEIRLPKLVKDEAPDPSTHRITMSYDKLRAGITVMITLLAAGTNSCYWYDLRTSGFFPESFPASCGVFSSVPYEAIDPDLRHVMYGCYDGFIRTFDDAAKDDDITTGTQLINSYVTFGPFLLSDSAFSEGKITAFDLILGSGQAGGSESDSDGATYELYVGKSAEEVLEKMSAGTPRVSGSTSNPGRSRGAFKRKVRGVYGGVKIKNVTATQTWAMEQALITVSKAGGLR